jgi:hypothetical protein
MTTKHADAFEAPLKELQAQHFELKQRRRNLALDIASKPAAAAKRTSELTQLNAELFACGEQLALLQEAQQVAADQDRLEAFERSKLDTVGHVDAALAAAKARVTVAAKIDAAFDTLTALLTTWESITGQVHEHTREVCMRTVPPGRRRNTSDRMAPISNVVQHSGATTGLAHRIFWSGLGRKGIPLDMILGTPNFGYGLSTTVAAEAEKGVAKLESFLHSWLTAAGTLAPVRQEQTEA